MRIQSNRTIFSMVGKVLEKVSGEGNFANGFLPDGLKKDEGEHVIFHSFCAIAYTGK
jgi:hypothetical protein